MPLALRQWHLYRFDFMVPVVGLEPTRCHHRRILNPLRLPIPSHRRTREEAGGQPPTALVHIIQEIHRHFKEKFGR